MSAAVRFLTALSQALASLNLYGTNHPVSGRAITGACERLRELQDLPQRVQFTFLPGEVLYGQEVLPELEGWEWGRRLAEAGIERLEFAGPVSVDELERFLDHLAARFGWRSTDSAEVWQMGLSNIRWGNLTLRGNDAPAARSEPLPIATLSYTLREECDAVGWLHREVGAGVALPLAEAEAVVRSLSLAMHADRAIVIPLLELKEFDQYTTSHSMNVSVLAMALAEYLELGKGAVRTVGLAALLHDLGKIRIPHEILVKPGKLTPAERRVVERHPVEGARIILDRDDDLDLAASVAYEHHLMIDGGGYPRLHFPRGAEYASRLVHVCDVYDALRTQRPYRDAWESEPALDYIQTRAGVEFDPAIARAFVRMMREWDSRRVVQAA
ncbi:MAG TPA: HD domain-containing phosphohydrolase [Gemmatimonadales bacterium]|nr:HD domain-containing phosphohydrolase [Gemmatimonadales bacterium]